MFGFIFNLNKRKQVIGGLCLVLAILPAALVFALYFAYRGETLDHYLPWVPLFSAYFIGSGLVLNAVTATISNHRDQLRERDIAVRELMSHADSLIAGEGACYKEFRDFQNSLKAVLRQEPDSEDKERVARIAQSVKFPYCEWNSSIGNQLAILCGPNYESNT